jgi:outer membrane receptor protein involved in Fe transport
MPGRFATGCAAIGGALTLTAATAEAQTAGSAAPTVLPTTEVIGTSPLLGSGVDRDKVPSATHSFSPGDLRREGSPQLPQSLERRLGSISFNEAQDNPHQPDVQFRGFTASPLAGTPQGLAVYQNGVRINEVFGDTVNWDAIPERAINRTNLVGSNPVFGLNALGGAIALEMKNGFTFQGGEIELSGGSFDRRGIEGEWGAQFGNFAAYIAAGGLNEEGWRDFSPSQIRRVYGDLGVRLPGARKGELHLSFTGADNTLTGNGSSPEDLLALRRESIFTYPDRTENKLGMVSLNGTLELTETLSLQAVAYYRRLRQKTLNGDLFEAEECEDTPGTLCLEEADGPALLDQFGAPIPDFLGDAAPGALNRTATSAKGMGGAAQLTHTGRLFERSNHLVAGLAYDRGEVDFSASNEIGALTIDRTVAPAGLIVTSADGTVAPVGLESTTNYYGIYVTDTLDVTDALSLTLGGRFNFAVIELDDQLGTSLDGRHYFARFNPAAGATYKITPEITAYAGYAEGNRAPTPAELSCADPTQPCTLASFFVSDPPLKQVVTHAYEAGLRGRFDLFDTGRVNWNVGLFRTDSEDDIIHVASTIQGRGFFQNAGTTRRQGIEAGASYRSQRWFAYADYAYVDATFRDSLVISSPANPFADADGTIAVGKGDRLPGVPEHRLKLGVDFAVVPDWTVGASLLYTSGQYLRGDEANLNPKIPGYTVVNLHTSYRFFDNFEIFGVVRNLFDEEYATFGTFAELGEISFTEGLVSNPRTISPGAPRSFFAGLRVIF